MPGQITRFFRSTSLPLFLMSFVAVHAACAQDTTILPQAQVGKPCEILLELKLKTTNGGKGPFTWKLGSGDFPPGLQVAATGSIEGTPTVAKSNPYTFDLMIFDSSEPPRPGVRHFSMVVQAEPLDIESVTATSAEPKILRTSTVEGTSNRSISEEPKAPGPSLVPEPAVALPAVPVAAEPGKRQPNPGAAAPSPDSSQSTKVQATDENKEWEARAIVGYHQAGASSAKFSQNFFFDFFIMRSLSDDHLWQKHNWNLWGDARIASSPQQITTGVGTFATNFATQASNLPVNQLAQGADFQTGLEYVLREWEPNVSYRMLGLVGYFGAMGVFQPPDAQMQIFNVPDKTSLQYPAFAAQFPTAANARYVGFVPPNRERFYRNYGFGVRITTFDKGQPLAPPATYTLSFGEDEAITGGIFRSVVGKIDVFYPLPLSGASGKYKFLYLFGNANLRLSKATSIPTFALQNPNDNGTTVQPFDPNLAVITIPSSRDTYRIGAGVDLINLIQSIAGNDKVTPKP
jgi:hypothetical protein